MIQVAGSHENDDKMAKTIYNALASPGYMMARITHHYSHNAKTDAYGASRHSGVGCNLALRHIAAIAAGTVLLAASFSYAFAMAMAHVFPIAQCLCTIFLHVLMHLRLLYQAAQCRRWSRPEVPARTAVLWELRERFVMGPGSRVWMRPARAGEQGGAQLGSCRIRRPGPPV